jgi:hypothetical protein
MKFANSLIIINLNKYIKFTLKQRLAAILLIVKNTPLFLVKKREDI